MTEAWKDEPDGRLQLLTAQSAGLDEDRDMAARCWDLGTLDDEYAEFLAIWEPKMKAWQRRQPQGADALVERTRFIHEYRMFPFKDPGLPTELLPTGWRGRQAHDVFLVGFDLLRAPAVAHYEEILQLTGEPFSRASANISSGPAQAIAELVGRAGRPGTEGGIATTGGGTG